MVNWIHFPSDRQQLRHSPTYTQSSFHSAKLRGVTRPSSWHLRQFNELMKVPNSVTSLHRLQSQSKFFVCCKWNLRACVPHKTSVYEIVKCSLALIAFGAQMITSPEFEKLFERLGRHECSKSEARWYIATLDGAVSGTSWPLIRAMPFTLRITLSDHLVVLKNLLQMKYGLLNQVNQFSRFYFTFTSESASQHSRFPSPPPLTPFHDAIAARAISAISSRR